MSRSLTTQVTRQTPLMKVTNLRMCENVCQLSNWELKITQFNVLLGLLSEIVMVQLMGSQLVSDVESADVKCQVCVVRIYVLVTSKNC